MHPSDFASKKISLPLLRGKIKRGEFEETLGAAENPTTKMHQHIQTAMPGC
jgi:hypothetical protein